VLRPRGIERSPFTKGVRAAMAGRSRSSSDASKSSVVGQSIQASVTDTPYFSCDRSAGMDWLPQCRWLSSMRPTMERLPSTTWFAQFSATSGCKPGSLFELPWLQSTTMFSGRPALRSSCSESAMFTLS
jgi:hypothetical protein